MTMSSRRRSSGATPGPGIQCLPTVPGRSLTPGVADAMQIALRRRLRLALPLTSNTCGGPAPHCGRSQDAVGDQPAACPHTGLLAGARVGPSGWRRYGRGGSFLNNGLHTHTHQGFKLQLQRDTFGEAFNSHRTHFIHHSMARILVPDEYFKPPFHGLFYGPSFYPRYG